jgi:ectoine hydroxylase-related dioxygenase (phytanoyl-CoA dioxygenase family)
MSGDRNKAMNELHHCLLSGPGVFVVRNLIPPEDYDVIDRAEAAFTQIIEKEKEAGQKGDHFAPAGANDRIWNSFQKFAQVDPEGFVRYFANEAM